MNTEHNLDQLCADFKKAAKALAQCSSDPGTKVSEMDQIETDLGKSARALMQCSSDPGQMKIRKLESDFGRSARAMMQCSSEPGSGSHSLRKVLQDDFAKAAIALMQCGMDPGSRSDKIRNLESEFGKAAVNLLTSETSANTSSKAQADFAQAAKALRQCGIDI
jgi:hypothetical protein